MTGEADLHLHPLSAGAYFLVLLSAALVYSHPLLLILIMSGGSAGLALSLRRGERLWRQLVPLLPLMLAIVGFNALISRAGATTIWSASFTWPVLGSPAVSLESLFFGITMALRIAAIWVLFLLWDRLVSADRTFLLLATWIPRTAVTFLLALRLVPAVLADLRAVQEVHRARGMKAPRTLKQNVQAYGAAFTELLVLTLERSLEVAEAMYARGFGAGRRTAPSEPFRPRDVLSAVGAVLVLAGLLVQVLDPGSGTGFYPVLQGFALQDIWWQTSFTVAGVLPIPLWCWGVRQWPCLRQTT